jgi:anti-sigma factor (TIGR02949 family)
MVCEEVIEQLSAYRDGQLTAAEMDAVRSHIAACARCRAESDALDQTIRAVADLPRLRAPADLRDRVMANLGAADPRSPASVEPGRTAPVESSPARWRAYWGAAAAIAVAVVIMLLTTPATHPPSLPVAVVPAEKNIPGAEIAFLKKAGSAGSNTFEDKMLRKQGESFETPALETDHLVPASAEQIVLPSANPQAAYSNAVALAVSNNWLPPGQPKDAAALPSAAAGQTMHNFQVLQLTLRMKRDQVPLLKNALASAGLQSAEKKAGRLEERQRALAAAPQFAPARENLTAAPTPRAAVSAKPLPGIENRSATMNEAMPAAPAVSAGSNSGLQQPIAERAVQQAETPMPEQAGNAQAAQEPFVQVTLLFPLAESPVPAAAPAAASNSVTAE